MGENCYKNGENIATNDSIDWLNVLIDKIDIRGLSAPAPGLYTCIFKDRFL